VVETPDTDETPDAPGAPALVDDDELAGLALTATPSDPFADDAVPFADDDAGLGLLPSWYMPTPSPRRSRSRTIVFAALAASLVVINVGGFCVTYGLPEFVWN